VPSQVSSQAANSVPPDSEQNVPIISKSTYDKAVEGMSYEEVKKLFGSPGKEISEAGTKGDEYFTAVYEWDNVANGSYASVVFIGNKLQSKSEYGLE